MAERYLSNSLEAANEVFKIEIEGLVWVSSRLDDSFNIAVDTIIASSGRVIICGMGKSGLIGRKIAATLASTGTRSYFMHPAEAFHGDLGMVDPSDVFIGISYSGETDELLKLLPFLIKNGNKFIAITGNESSTLSRAANIHLDVEVKSEACPLQLAPTSSTTATLVMGDALAVALMKARSFEESDFAVYHPGGSLGRRLLRRVRDDMRKDSLPVVTAESPVTNLINVMTTGQMGMAVVKHGGGYGVITDGDLRRALEKYNSDILTMKSLEIMTPQAIFIEPDKTLDEADKLMARTKTHALLVVESNQLIGVYKPTI